MSESNLKSILELVEDVLQPEGNLQQQQPQIEISKQGWGDVGLHAPRGKNTEGSKGVKKRGDVGAEKSRGPSGMDSQVGKPGGGITSRLIYLVLVRG